MYTCSVKFYILFVDDFITELQVLLKMISKIENNLIQGALHEKSKYYIVKGM